MVEELDDNNGFCPAEFINKPLTYDHTQVEAGCHKFVVPDILTAHMIAYRLCEQHYPQTLPVIEALDIRTPQANIRLDGFDIAYSLKRRRSRENPPQLIATIQAINNPGTKPIVDQMVNVLISHNQELESNA